MSDDASQWARMDERINNLTSDVAEVRKELYGNGNRGLKTAITELRQASRLVTWIGGIIAGALVLDLSSRVFEFAKEPAEKIVKTEELWKRDLVNPRNDPRRAEVLELRELIRKMRSEKGSE